MRARVLIADDDDELRFALKEALMSHGCDVVEARDGAEVLEALASALDGNAPRPDVLLLDVRMPAMSGLGVLSTLREIAPRVPAFLVTGLVDPSLDRVAAKLGGARVFRKPVDLHEIVAAILDAAAVGLGSRKSGGVRCGS